MWPQTPLVPKRTNLPVVCVDLYPFFGPNDPNGPHTDATSRNFLRSNARRMIDAIGDKSAVGWVMSQCFVEIWGPYVYNELSEVISLPGSYLHWRSPTVAEMRWQIWETFRSSCKGAFVFQLASIPSPDAAVTRAKASPDVAWKDGIG
ncbi:MAG: hypothetical protein JKX85_05160 [Phycisphaeraceae bacterium]|nr:hypothetical protein [Phycisphaeraceae bacterium]